MRRANGTGTIVNLGQGRRRPYAIKVSYVDRPGLIKQRYLSYHRTAREAQAALDQYNQGTVQLQAAPVTMGEVYRLWSTRKFAKAGDASVNSYKASWGRLCVLDKLPMDKITIDDLQRIIDQDESNGLSSSSLNNDKSLMKALFKFAMERDIIMKDYSSFVELPTVGPKYEKGSFNDLQMKKLEELAASGFPWADTVLMLCYTGFRISEFLSLTLFSYHEDGDYLQGGMKTSAGKNRVVPVHPKIKPYLSKWLLHNGDTIVCSDKGHILSLTWYRKNAFDAVMTAMHAEGATPHWCRHTFASRLKEAGADDLAVKRIMGHSDKNITEHYTHTDIAFLSRELCKLA